MAGFWTWKCNSCGYELCTSGDHEFYRDEKGMLHDYGHPVPVSEEAKKQGIKGFTVKWYCPKCQVVREVIITEFDKPLLGRYSVKNKRHNFEPHCSTCGTELKLLLDIYDSCPKCGNGYFEQFGFIAKS